MPSTRELMLRLPTPPYGDFQVAGVRFIQRTGGRCLLGHEQGCGKTYMTVAYAALNPDCLPMLVVCPASLKFNWQRELWRHGHIHSEVAEGRKPRKLPGKVWIINYDLVHDWLPLLLGRFKTVVTDECFPQGTSVSTPQGTIPIEKVQVGDTVLCFVNGEIAHRKVTHTFKLKRKNRLVRVHHSFGTLVCTEDHLILTEKGYVKAEALTPDDQVLVLSNTVSGLQDKKVLLNLLCSEVRIERREGHSTPAQSDSLEKDFCRSHRRQASRHLGLKNGKADASVSGGKDGEDQERERNTSPVEGQEGRERDVHTTTAHAVVEPRSGLAIGMCNIHGQKDQGVANVLQGGHRKSHVESWCRGGRESTPLEIGEIERSEKGSIPLPSRVESVEIYEHRDRGMLGQGGGCDFVYCLEVEDAHNFFAEGVLVSNCQRLINPGAKRTKALRLISRGCDQVIGLSGTPIKSRPIEFFPILHMIDPEGYPSRHNFGFRYCSPRRGYKGQWDFRGASNLDELHERLKSIMIRRRKKDVLKDLPATQRTVIPVVPENWKEYDRAEDAFVEWVLENKGVRAAQKAMKAELIIKLHELKRIAGRGKVKTVLEWARDFRDGTGEKLVLFAVQRVVTAALHDGLERSVMIRGDVNARDRQRAMDKFQNDPNTHFIVGNIDAMGEGVTLTAASTVVFAEIGWTPSDISQPEARTSRIGQTSKHIESFIFIAKNTVEERVWDMIEGKTDVVDQILDGEAAEKVLTRIAEDLVKSRETRRAG